jgi:hypothetical protein
MDKMQLDKMQLDKMQLDYYKLKDPLVKPFKISKSESYKLNIQTIIEQLIFIITLLVNQGYTLSYICPNDFVLNDNILFLNEMTHVVKICEPVKISKKGCFLGKGLRATIERTYASVGIFVFYLYTRKTKTTLKEEDYGNLVGTKPYYFIKNTQESNPILFYL